MDREKFLAEREWVRNELATVVDFWLKNGMDPVHGGVYTCLDRTGKVYSTDKSVWMQGRCGWMFAHMCNVYGVKQEWLDASKSCLDFMEAHCINREAGDRMYFTVTEDGNRFVSVVTSILRLSMQVQMLSTMASQVRKNISKELVKLTISTGISLTAEKIRLVWVRKQLLRHVQVVPSVFR